MTRAAATVEIIITKGLNSELIKRPRVSINMCFHAYYKTILEITISALHNSKKFPNLNLPLF